MWRAAEASFPTAEELGFWQENFNLAFLPMPFPNWPVRRDSPSRSSRLRHRILRRRCLYDIVCEMANTINTLVCGSLQARPRTDAEAAPDELKAAWASSHGRLFVEAKRLQVARRRFSVSTGVLAAATLLKLASGDTYGLGSKASPHAALRPHDVDEPANDQVVPMLSALPACEGRFYASESNVVDYQGKSRVLFEEVQQRYGFVSGDQACYAQYFHRADLPKQMWRWTSEKNVKAVMGFSTVGKKDSEKLRKVLMGCATNVL